MSHPFIREEHGSEKPFSLFSHLANATAMLRYLAFTSNKWLNNILRSTKLFSVILHTIYEVFSPVE
jgi:hypothetical protein